MNQANPSNILVRAPNWIGDQILAYPFYYFLRKKYPKAHIGVVGTDWVTDIQFMDCVDSVYVLPRMKGLGLLAKSEQIAKFASEISKNKKWDLGFSLPNSFSAALFLRLAGVKKRVGYSGDARSWLLTDVMKWNPDPSIHRSQAYLNLLDSKISTQKFWTLPAENDLDPPIQGEKDHFEPKKSWPKIQPLATPSGDYWVLAPGATAESRRWPIEYFLELVEKVGDRLKMPGVIVGGPAEVDLAQNLIQRANTKLIDMTSQGSVASLYRLFAGAKFTVCNESGLAHVASLCGSPVQIVCGAANPNRTAPLGPGKVRVSINPVDCWPCERNTCSQPDASKIKCLRGMDAERIYQEVVSLARIRA